MSQAGRFEEGSALTDVETLTPDTGGPVGADGAGNINILGGVGTSTSGVPATNTVTVTATSHAMAWSTETVGSINIAIDHGYVANGGALLTFILPTVANVGEANTIIGLGAGGWTLTQAAGQSIQFGNLATTVGAGGSLSSTNQFDVVTLICIVANTTWAVHSNIGVLNVV